MVWLNIFLSVSFCCDFRTIFESALVQWPMLVSFQADSREVIRWKNVAPTGRSRVGRYLNGQHHGSRSFGFWAKILEKGGEVMRCVVHMKDMRIVGRPRNGMQDSWVFRDVLLRGLDSFLAFSRWPVTHTLPNYECQNFGTTSQQSFRTGVCWGINGPQGCGWGAQNGKVSLTRPYLWQIWCFVRSQKYQTLRKRKVHDLDTLFADNLELII